MLGLQYLDVPHLRGRQEQEKIKTGTGKIGKGSGQRARKKEWIETKGDKDKNGVELIVEVSTSKRVGTSGDDSRVKKDKADRELNAKTRRWSNVVKGVKIKDKMETTTLDKSGNESEIANSCEMVDPDEPNQLKAKHTRRHRKSTPPQRNRRIEKR